MKEVTLYSAHGCPYCSAAEQLLRRKGVRRLTKIQVDTESGQLDRMMIRSGRRTVPQVFIGELHLGGFDDLSALERAGELDQLLEESRPET